MKLKFNFKPNLSKYFKTNFNRKRIWRTLLVYAGYFALAGIFFTAVAFAWFSKDLPTPDKLANRKPTISTKIYDRTGQTLLYETGDEKRTIITSSQISQNIKDATVAVEDASFYTNHGIEPKAILSAVMSRMLGKSSTLRGGSTITQQYVKNSFLTDDRSITRKIKEAILAVELEFMYNKDQILTMYLNEIPYGNANGGIEAASQMYYGKTANDLDIAEAATLAAIPQAPTYYSPYGTHIDKLIGRRNYVLDRMVATGKITKEQADTAKAEDTTTLGKDLKPRKEAMLAPHFAMYVLEQVANEYGDAAIQNEGLNIITTLDYDKQKMAQAAIDTGVPKNTKYGAGNAALVSVDPKTGQILAMVGSKDYFDSSIDGQVNVADSLRQPGSSFKPFAYATAFKQPEYSPSKIIYDFETNFGTDANPYTPHNYNGKTNGPVTMRAALDNSLNIPAVKVLALAGIDNTLRTASDMGITTLTHRADYGLSLVLGAGEVKPVEMAGAFGTFATGGVKHDLTPILKITDAGGNTLYDFDKTDKDGHQVLDPQVAYEINNVLSDNNARGLVFGLRSALYFPDRTVAAKTGTTSSFKDAWTVGYTPSLATAIWVGNSDGTAMKNGADGSVLAGPIFHDFMNKALSGTPNEEFAVPAGIQTVTVEKYSNKLPGPSSAETTTDIFADWQVPTDQDTLHKIVKVCKGTNLLAPSDLAANLTEDKIFTDLHSEKPDNPNWENPVIAWARANGLSSSDIPTEYCNANSVTPTISISAPSNNAQVSGDTDISANVTSGSTTISGVEFYIDGSSIGATSSSPYTKSYNFSLLNAGSHKIKAVATDSSGDIYSAEISITVVAGPRITNVVYRSASGSTISEQISWNTDVPSTGTINYHIDGSAATTSSADAVLSTAHQITISNLDAGKKYNFTITAKDNRNAQSISDGFSFTTALHSEAGADSLTPLD